MKTQYVIALFSTILIIVAGSIIYFAFSDENSSSDPDVSSDPTPSEVLTPGPVDEVRSDWPIYLTSMTHLEGNWTDAAENKDYFGIVASNIRALLDTAEDYGAVMTIESETPFAIGSDRFGDNVLKEVVRRGHGVGTHCDVAPSVDLPDALLVQEMREKKEAVDALVGSSHNLGCSGAGGLSDWYAGATGVGFQYLDGIVGFHLLALEMRDRTMNWTNDAIFGGLLHDDPLPFAQRYYPFLISELGFVEDARGDLLISSGTVAQVASLSEVLSGDNDVCERNCSFDQADTDAAVAFVRDFAAKHDGLRPAKLDFYIPLSTDLDGLEIFFGALEGLVDEGLVIWASQKEVYEEAVAYYDSL